MKTEDGVYTGTIISDEKDILDLKNRIKFYKPISQNDIAFLLHRLEKRGKKHLIPFFEKHIIEKDASQGLQVDTPHPKKKETTKTIEKEIYQTKTYKASDFQFLDKEIRVGKYVCHTERAFVIPHSILQKIQGEFTIKIRPDKTFYFDNHDLTRLLGLVEVYCYSYLDSICEIWFMDAIDSIEKDVKRSLFLELKDFILNENNGRYELKDNAIKYCPLSKYFLRYEFREFVNRKTNIPSIYRDKYKSKFPFGERIDKFNEDFGKSLTNIIRKYVYYTDKDLEVIKWYNEDYYKPSIVVDFMLTDEDANKGLTDWISVNSCIYHQQIEMQIKYAPKGALYDFGDEAISVIGNIIESLKEDSAYDLLKACWESIKTKQTVKYETDKYISNYSTTCTYDTKYRYRVNNPLLDISDEHYCIGHPKVEEYRYKLLNGYIHKITYFIDHNKMYSQEWPYNKSVDCYLLANDEYIALFALDYSKSTYVFKVKEGYIDIAMFFIWTYFSSSMFNKREGKSIRVERLFSYFGIEWYDNTGSPISKNEDGLYQFILPYRFYCNL